MIEENGHRWVEGCDSNERCVLCGMKYGYYLDIVRASKQQPKREDLKELLKCEERSRP